MISGTLNENHKSAKKNWTGFCRDYLLCNIFQQTTSLHTWKVIMAINTDQGLKY